jgi:hypothetical protein
MAHYKLGKAVKESEIDLTAYPVLTEEIGYPPSPLSRPSGGPSSPGSGGAPGGLAQVASRAIGDVLGWKTNATDAKGFIGALSRIPKAIPCKPTWPAESPALRPAFIRVRR